jgi:RNA polymerase sigma-70 factor (ECF subfamily)
MRRVAEGSQEAASELYRRYGPHIRRVVRRRLDPRLRPKFDSVDFVQDVWGSFFAHEFQKDDFRGPEALLKLLVTMTYNKVTEAFRKRLQSQSYDISLEHALDSATVKRQGEPAATDPTPVQVAEAHECWEKLLQGQSVRAQHILQLLREGHSHAEIARQLGLHDKEVSRLLDRLEQAQRTLQMWREGNKFHEIAQKVGLTEKTVRRLVRRYTRRDDS